VEEEDQAGPANPV